MIAPAGAELTAMFDDLDLVDPGVVPIEEWHPDNQLPRLGLTGCGCGSETGPLS